MQFSCIISFGELCISNPIHAYLMWNHVHVYIYGFVLEFKCVGEGATAYDRFRVPTTAHLLSIQNQCMY